MVTTYATDAVAKVPAESMVVVIFLFLVYLLGCGGIAGAFEHYKIPPPTVEDSFLGKLRKSKDFWMRLLFFVIAAVIGPLRIEGTCGRGDVVNYCDDWHLMFWFGLFFIITTNISKAPFEFFLGEGLSSGDVLNFYFRGKPMPSQQELEQASRDRWVKGVDVDKGQVGFATLMPSLFISWIFAKSIRNSAWLGGKYGMLGGLAYTSWYLSFFSAGTVCYLLRKRYNFKSLPAAVYKNYGASAVIIFQLCLFFRLFQEVWSNAGVIGGFYGATNSPGYWGGAWLSVAIPTLYAVMGGMRASLFSDVSQAYLAIVFLVVVLATIASDKDFSGKTDAFSYEPTKLYKATGSWDGGWWACYVGGSIQGIVSYPFFDPVMTDRGFLGTPASMLKSFYVAGTLSAIFIFFFAVIGVYGAFFKEHYNEVCGCSKGAIGAGAHPECPSDWNPCANLVGSVGEASDVARIIGNRTSMIVEVIVNFIMITASISTLDSTFISTSKLISLEFCGWVRLEGDRREHRGPLNPQDLDNIGQSHIMIARATMVFLGLWGTAFLGIEGDVMQATTAAGTCVMGIGAPIWFMTVWVVKREGRRGWRQSPLAFVVPTIVGYVFGFSLWAQGRDTDKDGKVDGGWAYDLSMGSSDKQESFYYSAFLGVNVVGHLVCIGLFFIFFALHQLLPMLGCEWFPEVEPEAEEGTTIRLGGPVGNEETKVPDAQL